MVFSFARVDDVYAQHRRLWVRLREKSGNWHEMPYHHTLEAYLHTYPAGASIQPINTVTVPPVPR